MLEPFRKIEIDIVKKLINEENPEDKIMVDLGAGDKPVTDNIKCKKRIRVDISPRTKPDIVCDLNKGIPLTDRSVDIVICCQVIEHIYHGKIFVSEVRRILKENGVFILTTPNICCLKYRIAFLLGKIPSHAAKADMFYEDGRFGHIRDFNFEEIEKLLNMFNFKIEKRESDGIHIKGYLIIPQIFLPKTFGDNIIVKARKV